MKIAIISYPYLHFFGGAERYVDEFARAMTNLGCEIVIFTARNYITRQPKRKSAYKVVEVPTFINPGVKYKTPHEIRLFHAMCERKLRAYIKKHGPFDIINGQCVNVHPGFAIEKEFHIPTVTTVNDWDLGRYHKYAKDVYERVDHIIVIQKYIKDKILDYYKIPESKITIRETAIDTKLFAPSSVHTDVFSRILGKKVSGLVLFTAQRMDGRKDMIPFLKATKKIKEMLPDVTIFVGGGGPDKGRYVSYVEKMGLADLAHFTGYLSDEDLLACYREADIFFSATWGQVTWEAMASQTATILAEVHPACKEYLTDEKTGLMVKQNPEAIARAVIRLAEDTELREQLAQKGMDLVRLHFSWEKIAQEMLKDFENIITRFKKQTN